jgi:DnaK suppressor protein
MADAALNQDHHSIRNGPPHMAELASDAFEQQLTLALLGNRQDVLERIEAALRRVEDGTYGRCEDCGKVVAEARLEAIPFTALCVKCAAERERGSSWRPW